MYSFGMCFCEETTDLLVLRSILQKGIRREGEKEEGRENEHQNHKGKTSVSFKATKLVKK